MRVWIFAHIVVVTWKDTVKKSQWIICGLLQIKPNPVVYTITAKAVMAQVEKLMAICASMVSPVVALNME